MSVIDLMEKKGLLGGKIQASIGPDPGMSTLIGYYDPGKQQPYFNYPMKDDAFHGECVCWHANGKMALMEHYEMGRLEGKRTEWYKSGLMKSEMHYKAGVCEGPAREWYPEGALRSECEWSGGQRDGSFKQWYPDGVPAIFAEYRNNFLQSTTERYPSGAVMAEARYRNGRIHGVYKEWFPSGKLKTQANYVAGEPTGEKLTWFSLGRLASREQYVAGRLNGRCRTWNDEGVVVSDLIYVRGVVVATWVHDLIKTGKLRAEHILKMDNVAVRRICLEELGYARFLAQTKHGIIDRDGDYELACINWHRSEEPIYLVKVKCPTTGAFYALRVPPTMKTAKQAVAWTFGMRENSYTPHVEA